MKYLATDGIVLKRSNYGEADRIVTVLTREYGKIAAVAKSVRKLSSSKKSFLEPGMRIKLSLVKQFGLPVITQAKLIQEYSLRVKSLEAMRDSLHVLEIFDSLCVEGEDLQDVYDKALEIVEALNNSEFSRGQIKKLLEEFVEYLGYPSRSVLNFSTVNEYVEYLTEKKLHAFSYLTVQGR